MHPRTLAWFEQYAADHRHPTNRLTHKVAIPVILFHIFGMLGKVGLGFGGAPWLSLGLVMAVLTGIFWIYHLPKAGVLLAISALVMAPVGGMLSWSALLGLAVVGWVVQLAGHSVWEKNRPSFARNMLQALVGPLFFAAIITREWPRARQAAA
jgi:uncharacterized membrane protein YGL010W